MLRRLLLLAVAAATCVVVLGVYLAPNDLRPCGDVPDQAMAACQPADAIIAISGGDTTARAREAIALYQAGWAKRIIFSGAAADKSGPSNAEAMRTQALAAGIPASAISTDDVSSNTRQNAQHALAAARLHDVHQVILVTSPYHQRRAYIEFERASGGSVAIRNHPTTSDHYWPRTWFINITSWWLAVGELGRIIGVYIGASV